MSNKAKWSSAWIYSSIAILTAYSFLLEAAAPEGWLITGSKPQEYDCEVDSQAMYNNKPSAYLEAKKADVEGFGTLMQFFSAGQYTEKRVRLSAFVKSEGVRDWAGLWMRVDKGKKLLAFDNMQDRPIKGTTAWHNYEVVLDVPPD